MVIESVSEHRCYFFSYRHCAPHTKWLGEEKYELKQSGLVIKDMSVCTVPIIVALEENGSPNREESISTLMVLLEIK